MTSDRYVIKSKEEYKRFRRRLKRKIEKGLIRPILSMTRFCLRIGGNAEFEFDENTRILTCRLPKKSSATMDTVIKDGIISLSLGDRVFIFSMPKEIKYTSIEGGYYDDVKLMRLIIKSDERRDVYKVDLEFL